jgi:arginine utilization regulatory protein
MAMNQHDYETLLTSIIEVIDEGVQVVSRDGRTLFYNSAMARIEDTARDEVLGKKFSEAFSQIPVTESTLHRALMENKATQNSQQTYLNKYGKAITTVNTTLPIEVDGRVIAAVEIAKDITHFKNMSDTLLELQEESIKPSKLEHPRIRHYNFSDIIGQNEAFRDIIHVARKAAKTKASVFIYGETGTGKELIAQSIHYDGDRQNGPFLAQNCAALPESLLESILFGTAKGGFTGAVDRAGLFEQANGGTLLLDEISAMPYELQSKLLRVLQEDYIRRIGGTKDVPVDVRIIATVNEEPELLIAKGALRKDLYYRLSIVNLNMIPLRKRKDDIPLLTERLLEKQCRRFDRRIAGISTVALEKLMAYDYPGNVRELENVIMSAVSLADENDILNADHIHLNHRPLFRNDLDYPEASTQFRQGETAETARVVEMQGEAIDAFLARLEKDALERAMKQYNGNVSQAAASLGIKRQTLQHKLKRHGCK